jgi:signal transduction histidine kinase
MPTEVPPRSPAPADATADLWRRRWQRFSATTVKAFHAYASWLVSISWKRFAVLAFLLLMMMGILHDKPPFTWKIAETVEESEPRRARSPKPPKPPKVPAAPATPATPANPATAAAPVTPAAPPVAGTPGAGSDAGVDISIGKEGIRIQQRPAAPAQLDRVAAAAAAAAAAASGASAAAAAVEHQGVHISLPSGANSETVREAVAQARRDIEEAVREARQDAEEAARDALQAQHEAERALAEITSTGSQRVVRRTSVGIGDAMMQFTVLWIMASIVLKATYKGRMQAERQAAQATETAESESLKRQVLEARMAAMQAQVEPHFLFNTLASIDHLIETDPPRASLMQKNLIALLRANMPSLREANEGGARDLARELAVIRPYLEILKVRMDERLSTQIDVPEGLQSAEFPPMMIQTLVENAIKHGLEPKAEGGHLSVRAQVVHGQLEVSVADTGLGFGRAATAGTGVGLNNVRERLQLLYGGQASLKVTENQPTGTVATITVPYRTVAGKTPGSTANGNANPAPKFS